MNKTTDDAAARVERDFKGHLIVADSCQWFRTTDVGGKWRVSSIGEYVAPCRLPDTHANGFTEIGWRRLYETMVFPLGADVCPCGCGAPLVSEWTEIETDGYMTRDEAAAGHEAMVAKYLEMAP